MDYEKKYKEANNKVAARFGTNVAKEIFTDLYESDDERIRKELIEFVKSRGGFKQEYIAWLKKQGTPNQTSIWKHWKDGVAGNGEGKLIYLIKNGNDYLLSSCLGFECDYIELSELDNLMLEKQGNSADNVGPNFHIGDCVVDSCGYVWKIEGILNQFYILEGIEGGESRPTIEWVNKTFHLWTIQDAKKGDILADKYGVYIYDQLDISDESACVCICGYQYSDKKFEPESMICNKSDFYPADKEQRDLLFSKMKEAGYQWDETNKVLIAVKPTNAKFNVDDTIQYNGLGHNEYVIKEVHYPTHYINELGERMDMPYTDANFTFVNHTDNSGDNKYKWGEEDEKTLNEMFSVAARASLRKSTLFGKSYDYIKWQNWLKSLKDRVQPKQEWNEYDEDMRYKATAVINKLCAEGKEYVWSVNTLKQLFYWLKSLKPQNTWKPSDKQMHAFEQVYDWYNNNFAPSETLTSLYNDLKKLKG